MLSGFVRKGGEAVTLCPSAEILTAHFHLPSIPGILQSCLRLRRSCHPPAWSRHAPVWLRAALPSAAPASPGAGLRALPAATSAQQRCGAGHRERNPRAAGYRAFSAGTRALPEQNSKLGHVGTRTVKVWVDKGWRSVTVCAISEGNLLSLEPRAI